MRPAAGAFDPFDERRFLGALAERIAALGPRDGALVEWRSPGPPLSWATTGRAAETAVDGVLRELGLRASADGPEPVPGAVALWAFDPHPPTPESDPSPRPASEPGPPLPASVTERPPGPWRIQLHLAPAGAAGRVLGSLRGAVAMAAAPALGAYLGGRLRDLRSAARFRPVRAGRGARRELRTGALRRFASRPAFLWEARRVPTLAPPGPPYAFPSADGPREHAVLFGASGAGKTARLVDWGARAIQGGRPVVAFDLHGDLGPGLVAALDAATRERIVAIDAEAAEGPGIDLLGPGAERDRAHLVGAFRRGSDDRGELYWGHRLERIFDVFVGLTAEEGGGLGDLYALLTEERRREAARLGTASPMRAEFLDGLRPILARNPEFLWPAAARVARVVGSEPLARRFASADGGIDLGALVEAGRSVVLRLPIGLLGPEAAGLAATLVAARLYLDRTRLGEPTRSPLLFLFDEAQAFSPLLLSEILSEGRKFGVTAVVASQYPGRLAPALREAAAGAVSVHLAMRTPEAALEATRRWMGWADLEATRALSALPTGAALALFPGQEAPQYLPPGGAPAPPAPGAWEARIRAAAREFSTPGVTLEEEELTPLLRRIRAAELQGGPVEESGIDARRVRDGAAGSSDPELRAPIERLLRRGWLARRPDGRLEVSPPGLAFLGERRETGAVRESELHRALLREAVRLFARHSEALQIVRQGRFDTRLPDAFLPMLPPEAAREPPVRLAELLSARRRTWAWRAFGGRDVHVEAEVSGASRKDRIRRDLSKASAGRAHCLFLVPDAGRAQRLRRILDELGADRRASTVWVLRTTGEPNRPRE